MNTINKPTNFHTKKQLGQHLLIDNNIISTITSYANDIKNTNTLEIGAGTGNLTNHLIKKANYVFAIEKDKTAEPFLDNLKKNNPQNFDFVIEDALNYDLLKLKQSLISQKNLEDKFAIIANLPYNVGTELFTSWLPISQNFNYFILMFQLEVAQRITANTNDQHYGRLALFTKLFGDSQLLFTVSKDAFNPPPKVDSAVILFTPHKTPLDINIKNFETITKSAFANRRKMIRQSLKHFDFDFKDLNIDETLRPENLTFQEFCKLTQYIT